MKEGYQEEKIVSSINITKRSYLRLQALSNATRLSRSELVETALDIIYGNPDDIVKILKEDKAELKKHEEKLTKERLKYTKNNRKPRNRLKRLRRRKGFSGEFNPLMKKDEE